MREATEATKKHTLFGSLITEEEENETMAEVGVSSAWSSSGLLSLQSQDCKPLHPNEGTRVRRSLHVQCATQSLPVGGPRIVGGKRVKVLEVGDKSASLRDKVDGEPSSVKLLSRVQQLRLLTKAEKAGLLSAAERAGLSLSIIEKLGLLSKAEDLGVLSAATDPSIPGSLFVLALVLLVGGPAFVYFVPEDALWQVVLQFVMALATVFGGSAAFAASSFVSSLQKSD